MGHPFLKLFALSSLLHLRIWELTLLIGDAAAYKGYLPTVLMGFHGVRGQSCGRTNKMTAKTTKVRGTPTFR